MQIFEKEKKKKCKPNFIKIAPNWKASLYRNRQTGRRA